MRSSAVFYIFEVKLKQKKLTVKFFATKNVVRYTFYSEKVLYATLFTTKKC